MYFGKRPLRAMDRIGSVRGNRNGAIAYFPWGEERPRSDGTLTADGTDKFGTYFRDIEGQDYANARYYNSNLGRFWTPDPYMANNGGPGDPADPASWNRYAYVRGDPVNRVDPGGTCDTEDENGDGPHSGFYCFGLGLTGPTAPSRPVSRGDGNSKFPKCNPDLSDQKEQMLSFVATAYYGAKSEAGVIESQMPTLQDGTQFQMNQANLIEAFIDWSYLESHYGQSSFAKSNNNYFGYGNVKFPTSMSWGTELAYILAIKPITPSNDNDGQQPYSSFLDLALMNNPNASPAEILQAIANAGYNTNPNYGNQIAGDAKSSVDPDVKSLLNCLLSNKYIQ
jgi:RHS repeat-associated protein